MLHGRAQEQSVIDRLLSDCRAGRSGGLFLTGEPGIGKTALLDHAASAASGFRLVRGTGIESEAHLPFAGLHLLLRPALDRVDALPVPQARALRGAFGLVPVEPGDRMLVGLAVLSLLAELADSAPVLCLVDDAQWLDRASAEAVLFTARRLDAEGIAVIVAARPGFAAPGLTELPLTGLDAPTAAGLLAEHAADLSPADRYRVLAEAQGNPLALLELPAAVATHRPIAAGQALPLSDAVQAVFLDQAQRLPEPTRQLLLVAAAEDAGDLGVVLRAGAALGSGAADLVPAEVAGLVRVDQHTVHFRHPLVRSALYQAAPTSLRFVVHTALADALDRPDDADRRAWHRAMVATGPDEQVAAELEHTALRAATRSGYATAVAAYERAARLTPAGENRVRRLVLAAEAAAEEGDAERMAAIADRAAASTREPEWRARALRVRASAAFHQGSLRAAQRLLTEAAGLVSAGDPLLAAHTMLDAVHAAWYLGADEIADTARQLDALPLPPGDPITHVARLLSWAVRAAIGQGWGGAAADRIGDAARTGFGGPDETILVGATSLQVAGHDTESHRVAAQLLAGCREHGWIGRMPPVLACVARAQTFLGRHGDAWDDASEALRIAQEAGHRQWIAEISGVLAYLAAVAGDEQRCHALADDAVAAPEPGAPAPAPGLAWAQWALALLDLGHARWESARARLDALRAGPVRHQLPGLRSIPDLVEAAVRLGRPEDAREPLARLTEWARQVEQPWIDAHVERCRALLAPDHDADELYRAALRLHAQDDRPFERARTALLYGEWLRRIRRRSEARARLRDAFETFRRLDAAPWAARARTELDAAGDAVPDTGTTGALARLTPQERKIVRLAARGLSNRDIAAQLFLSPRTVGYHLYKAYPKLGVTARTELAALEPVGANG